MPRFEVKRITVVCATLVLAACAETCPRCEEAPPAAALEDEGTGGEAPIAERGLDRFPAEVRALEAAPRRSAPPGTASVAILARGENAFVARLEMAPNAAVPEHQDPDEEYIHVLEGRGTMWIDGTEYEVTPGTTIYMPAHSTVRFQNGDAPLVALQVFAGPGSAAKYDRWIPMDGEE